MTENYLNDGVSVDLSFDTTLTTNKLTITPEDPDIQTAYSFTIDVFYDYIYTTKFVTIKDSSGTQSQIFNLHVGCTQISDKD